jgi:hypothetical protein
MFSYRLKVGNAEMGIWNRVFEQPERVKEIFF